MWLRCDSLLELTIGDYLACPVLFTHENCVQKQKIQIMFCNHCMEFLNHHEVIDQLYIEHDRRKVNLKLTGIVAKQRKT